jgi:geranylgeranyl pyrophosphate synthase
MTSNLSSYLAELRALIDGGLSRSLRADVPAIVTDAMRYGLLGGGKRLRPCLTLAVADAVASRTGVDAAEARQRALPAACAVELIHAYSLIHDDLPAMDNDTLRRGRPTTHVIYGDGLAILAGDGLLTEAFGLLSAPRSRVLLPDAPAASLAERLRAIDVLVGAAGSAGMVGGQAIDLVAAGRVGAAPATPLDAEALREMHARKTGALIRAACVMGAILTSADALVIDAVDRYATELGLAFQIIDDILDVEGSPDALGKTAGKDAAAGKPTYPSLFGLDESRRLAAACVSRAKAGLAAAELGGRLGEIAEWSLRRTH